MDEYSEVAFARNGIGVRIGISGVPVITSGILVAILERLEEVFASIEISESSRLARELNCSLGDLETISNMTTHWRRSLHGRMISIEKAEKGSLYVIGLIAAASYWILEKTIGKTLEEAWAASEANQKLKNFLNRRLTIRTNRLCAAVNGVGPVHVEGVGLFGLRAELQKHNGRVFLDVVAEAEDLYSVDIESQVEAWRSESTVGLTKSADPRESLAELQRELRRQTEEWDRMAKEAYWKETVEPATPELAQAILESEEDDEAADSTGSENAAEAGASS